MTIRTLALASLLATSTASSSLAQTPAAAPPAQTPRGSAPPAAAPAAPVPERPRREGQPINVKVELTITDQRGSVPPTKRTISLIVGDERTGSIRTQSSIYRMSDVPLNVDASPSVLSDGRIRLGFGLQYDWPAPIEPGKDIPVGSVTRTTLHDSLSLILENGKPMIAAQSADPIGDRQVTVEVKATVLR
jgi:hypothetical protein